MDLNAALPEWLVWMAAGVIGAVGLAAMARIVLACLDMAGD